MITPEVWPALDLWQHTFQAASSRTTGSTRGARVDGRLVGIAHFLVHASTTSADVCYLQDLFTAPQARGRGVARALIASVEHWARERGCARVYCHTQSGNETARRLYNRVAENRGFIQYLVQL